MNIDLYTKITNNFANAFISIFGVSLEELKRQKENIQREGMTPTKIILPEFKIFGLPIEFRAGLKEIRIEYKKN